MIYPFLSALSLSRYSTYPQEIEKSSEQSPLQGTTALQIYRNISLDQAK
ncbi:hypothetical protein PORCRE_1106 [Porphyromonas crevioricanis JCM 15906]|uniref:Uncharacterized protein n=1 Tax=Porphyromonas crevioricanis JCM 15906 TaxID=1305617 RepID=T1DRS2_9PORP|nr:hypothetical protein PORCRE_1106 [Porphyromonas crevioricanis JCM 15906]GAD07630.1 hypothetical protein PORCAN_1253 [Porphyromonas crevioricanis JCM 13913]